MMIMLKQILDNMRKPKRGIPVSEMMIPGAETNNAGIAGRLDRAFSRSVRIRQVSAGSCNACEWECIALTNPFYDVQRFGLDFVASPRHADIVLVSGPVSAAMAEAFRKTYLATPGPKLVIACGDCSRDGGVYKGSYAVTDGAGAVLPIDSFIPGCPPSPSAIFTGIMNAIKAAIGIEAFNGSK